MQRAGSILKKFISNYGLESALTLTKIKNQWLKLVGQAIAAHTFPDVIKGKTIFITVDTPQWMHHLNFYKLDMCEKLKHYKISEIRFKLGKLPEEENIKQAADKIALTDEDSRFIESTVRNLKDNELKEKLRGLLTHGLMNRKKK